MAPYTRRQVLGWLGGVGAALRAGYGSQGLAEPATNPLLLPEEWEYSAPLIAPIKRSKNRSRAQKDPTVVRYDDRWHVFMTAKLPGRSVIEYCSFRDWNEASQAEPTILGVSDSDYYCAPQVFFFEPQKKWYLIYQMGVPGQQKMWVAYSATTDIADPKSWTRARPILDGGLKDPRKRGGLDYWIICDERKAYLFFTSLDGRMWRLWTSLEEFPRGFRDCTVALRGKIFEASHTYRIRGREQYLTIVEQNEGGRRYYKAFVAERLDGVWRPLADSAERPFAGAANIRPARGVGKWTDNVSHGELIRSGYDQTLTVDPADWQFLFQGCLDAEMRGRPYGQIPWRIGLLRPVRE